jgi:hypothetical protein
MVDLHVDALLRHRRLEEAHNAHRTSADGVAEEAGHELLGERHLAWNTWIRPLVIRGLAGTWRAVGTLYYAGLGLQFFFSVSPNKKVATYFFVLCFVFGFVLFLFVV